ncbi:hypothetical protein [Nocardia vermiculata]|nr:hypothetical protein [Nocardia vermiculata]
MIDDHRRSTVDEFLSRVSTAVAVNEMTEAAEVAKATLFSYFPQ